MTCTKTPIDSLRQLAAYYRNMARTASTPEIREALLRLAERYERLAAKRSQQLDD